MENLKFVVFNTNNTYGNTMGGAGKANRLKIAEEVGFDLKRLFIALKTQERGAIYTLKSEDLANYYVLENGQVMSADFVRNDNQVLKRVKN